jgi:HPt (histidine-containing phosphotransfer) domain-containing protein
MKDKIVMDKEPIHVIVESDLQDLIPNFMQRRHDDLEKLREALATGDFETVRVIGHSMKGTGGGYGFDGISEFGAAIEKAAKDAASADARSAVDALEDYLARVQVTFN